MEKMELETVKIIGTGLNFPANLTQNQIILPTAVPDMAADNVTVLCLPFEVISPNILNNYILGQPQKPTLILTGNTLNAQSIFSVSPSSEKVTVDTDNILLNDAAVEVVSVPADELPKESVLKEEKSTPLDKALKELASHLDYSVEIFKKKSWVCEKCDLHFEIYDEFKSHILTKHCDKPYKCSQPDCCESFNHEMNLMVHSVLHSDKLVCPVCVKQFSRLASLKSHLRLHEKEDTLQCLQCGEEFSNPGLLEIHKKEHTSVSYNCDQCPRYFRTSMALKQHLKGSHKIKSHRSNKRRRKKGSYKCQFCSKDFCKPSQVARHELIHTGIKPYKCHLCSKAFNQKGTLEIHMRKHNGDKPYKCDSCNISFTQSGNLKKHIQRLHRPAKIKDRNYRCHLCPSVLKRLSSLNSHLAKTHGIRRSADDDDDADYDASSKCNEKRPTIKRKSIDEPDNVESVEEPSSGGAADKAPAREGGPDGGGDPIVVEQLEMSVPELQLSSADGDNGFLSRTTLTTFLLPTPQPKTVADETQEKENSAKKKVHKCDVCPLTFKGRVHLERHYLTHTSEKPFKCSECPKSFRVKSNLTVHEKTHRLNCSEDKVTCDICQKVFSSLRVLKRHQLLHSKDLKYKCTICESEFDSPNARKDHFRECHSTDSFEKMFETFDDLMTADQLPEFNKKHECDECGLLFKRRTNLKEHLSRHTGEKPYTCVICNKNFGHKVSLKRHVLVHSKSSRECRECGRIVSRFSYQRHLKAHFSIEAFQCPICARIFKSRQTCLKHISAHSPSLSGGKQRPIILSRVGSKSRPKRKNILPSASCPEQPPQTDNVIINTPVDNGEMTVTIENLQTNNQDHLSPPISEVENFVSLEKLNQQLFSLANGQKSSLFEPALENCVFLQSENLDLEGQAIGANLNVILPPPEIARDNETRIVCYTNDKNGSKETDGALQLTAASNILLQNDLVLPCKDSNQKEINNEMPNLIPFAIFKCSKCDYMSTSFDEFENHLKSHESFACQICSESMDSQQDLETHLLGHSLKIPDQPKTFSCSTCSLKFSSLEEVIGHAQVHKMVPRIDVVDSLKEETNKKREAKKKVGKGALVVSEEEAQALVDDVSNLSQLSLSEIALRQSLIKKKRLGDNPEPEAPAQTIVHANKCKYCPKSFRKPSDLLRHERIHTGERPYSCFCGKSFAVKTSRTSHLQTHFKESAIPCHVCGRSFSSPSSLKLHMRLHTGSKPFVCTYCNARFRTSGHKKAHMQTHMSKGIGGGSSSSTTSRGARNRYRNLLPDEEEEGIGGDEDDNLGEATIGESCVKTSASADGSADGGNTEMRRPKLNFDDLLEVFWDDDGGSVGGKGGGKGIQLRLIPHNQDPPQAATAEDNLPLPQLTVKIPSKSNVGNKNLIDNFTCPKCKESFNRKALLEKHLKTHHSEDEALSCKICKKKFDTPCELELHSLVHTLENELICPKCQLSFADQSSLALHACSGKPAKSSSLLESASIDLSDLIFFTVPQ